MCNLFLLNNNVDYSTTLPWLTRIKIAIGAAQCLAFLHEEEKPVIYRDFKAANILLDSVSFLFFKSLKILIDKIGVCIYFDIVLHFQDYNSKLSDFGLAIDGPQGDDSHITTCVMGTEGYAAPEYINTGNFLFYFFIFIVYL